VLRTSTKNLADVEVVDFLGRNALSSPIFRQKSVFLVHLPIPDLEPPVTTLTIQLPGDLAARAQQAGLLESSALARLLTEKLAPMAQASQAAASGKPELDQLLDMILAEPLEEAFLPPRSSEARAAPFSDT
jgi:hypothetical protein